MKLLEEQELPVLRAQTVNESAGKAVAKHNNGGHAIVAQYSNDLHQVMPSHINRDQ